MLFLHDALPISVHHVHRYRVHRDPDPAGDRHRPALRLRPASMILAEGAQAVPSWRRLVPLPSEIIWSLIFLVIFAVVFMKFVLPRLNAVLDERAEKIEGGLRNAEKVQEQVDQLKSDQEQE